MKLRIRICDVILISWCKVSIDWVVLVFDLCDLKLINKLFVVYVVVSWNVVFGGIWMVYLEL